METLSAYTPRMKPKTTWRSAAYDGDSLCAGKFYFDFGWGLTWAPIVGVRVIGLDTPEKRPRHAGRTKDSLALEKKAAKMARAQLIEWFETADVVQFNSANKMDKYGRFLGDFIFTFGEEKFSAAERLVELKHARFYTGDKKVEFDDWYDGPAKYE